MARQRRTPRRSSTPSSSIPSSSTPRIFLQDRYGLLILLVSAMLVALCFWMLWSPKYETGVLMEPRQIFHSPDTFYLNCKIMEKTMKVFVYNSSGAHSYSFPPRPMKGLYGSEGYFLRSLHESNFLTMEPSQADLFLIPLSCYKMHKKGIDIDKMTIIINDYIHKLIDMYVYWNRSSGADHFFVTCIEAGVKATERVFALERNAVRVLCSPHYKAPFTSSHKDVFLPQVVLPFVSKALGTSADNRTILGFWSGHRNSEIRFKLENIWSKDSELDIQTNKNKGGLVDIQKFYRSKFCICPASIGVTGANVANSIHYGCVPVIMSNHYELPFKEILDWNKFSLSLREEDVFKLKKILKGVSLKEYRILQNNIVKVQHMFEWNSPPKKYDAFHMVMYQLWVRHKAIAKN